MNRRIVRIAAILAGVLAAVWLAVSPYTTLSRMRDAAQARDAATLNAHIDYEALRADLKAKVAAEAAKEMAKGGGNAAGAAFAAAFIGPMIDAMVQPTTMAAMLQGQGKGGPAPKARIVGDDVHVRRTGIGSFVVESDGRAGGPRFELKGFTWKLVGIDAPL